MFKLHYEVWKPIKGFEGLYEVSNYCKVKSVKRNSLICHYVNEKGYIQIVLWKDGKSKNTHSHRLGAEAFIPNPYNLPCINHKDENPSNNYISINGDGSVNYDETNLEWISYSDNLKYKGALDRMIDTRNKNNSYGSEKKVYQYSLDGVFIKEYKSVIEAAIACGYCEGFISMVCSGKRKCSKYIFKYE